MPNKNVKGLEVLIMAAGNSSRMGNQVIKQLLQYKGQSFLELTIKKALTFSKGQDINIVLGANDQKILSEIEQYPGNIFHNEKWEIGLGESIGFGVRQVLKKQPQPQGLLILLADQPEIMEKDSIHIENLIKIWTENPEKICATSYGSNPGVPVIFPQSHFSSLSKLSGKTGAKPILEKNKDNMIILEVGIRIEDIDLPEDYERLLKRSSKN